MPKILRRDLILFQVGVSARQMRKDRDSWKLTNEGNDLIPLYYEDIRPRSI